MTRRTCDLLGVCQQHTPACLGCDHHALAASVQASRDTGCCAALLENDDSETLTPTERIAYWVCVGLAVGGSIGVVFGAGCYLAVKAFY